MTQGNSRILAVCTAFFLVLAPAAVRPAAAASLYLTTTSDTSAVQTGDRLVFDVIADFTGEPTFGGNFDIEWDPTALRFEGLNYISIGGVGFDRMPDVEEDRLLGWTFGAFTGIEGVNTLGQVEFSVLPTMAASTLIDFGCNFGIEACSFITFPNAGTSIDVARVPTHIARVPLPASVFLFVGALGALAGCKPRRPAS